MLLGENVDLFYVKERDPRSASQLRVTCCK
jgi:hypothetical protein